MIIICVLYSILCILYTVWRPHFFPFVINIDYSRFCLFYHSVSVEPLLFTSTSLALCCMSFKTFWNLWALHEIFHFSCWAWPIRGYFSIVIHIYIYIACKDVSNVCVWRVWDMVTNMQTKTHTHTHSPKWFFYDIWHNVNTVNIWRTKWKRKHVFSTYVYCITYIPCDAQPHKLMEHKPSVQYTWDMSSSRMI